MTAHPYHAEANVWVGGQVPDTPFEIDICSGAAREGDVASWITSMCQTAMTETAKWGFRSIRVDVKVGGYAHNVDLPDVQDAIVALATLPHCAGVRFALPCGPFSVI